MVSINNPMVHVQFAECLLNEKTLMVDTSADSIDHYRTQMALKILRFSGNLQLFIGIMILVRVGKWFYCTFRNVYIIEIISGGCSR